VIRTRHPLSSGRFSSVSLIAATLLVTFLATGCEKQSQYVGGYKYVRYCFADGCNAWKQSDEYDPAPPGPNPPYLSVAIRQANCSLTRDILDSNYTVQTAYTITNYQDFLHTSSGSTTTPDQFKNGCKDPTTGIASQLQGVAIGPLANGNFVLAGLAGSGIVLTVITDTGQTVSTQTVSLVPAGQSGASVYSAATADLNGDGNGDIVVTSFGFSGANQGQISILLGNGDGTFKTPANIPVAAVAQGVTIDDMNNDGKLDLVVVGLGSPGLEFLPGNGDGTFGTPIASSNSKVSALFAVSADFNNDGNKDVALSSGQILLGDGTGNFTLQSQTLPTLQTGFLNGTPSTLASIAAADFNLDGKIDLAVTNAISLTVDLYFGNGNGTFTYRLPIPPCTVKSIFNRRTSMEMDIPIYLWERRRTGPLAPT
jgi:VCBS repeat protein